MKLVHLAAALSFGFATPTFAAGDHDHRHEHKPLHGGIVTEVRDVDYELVVKPELIQLHLRDHGQTVDVAKTTARLTLLSGAEKQEIELKPAGKHLEAKGSFRTAGAKAVALVSQAGKAAVSVRFALK